MNFTEETQRREYIYKGKIINLRVDEVLLSNGSTAMREVVEHNGGVCVAALTDKNEILMVKQFRYPYMEETLEIPAGKRDKGEEPLHCGIRELKEETGATAETVVYLGEMYPTPGYCSEILWMYAAKGLSFGETDLDEDEFLEVCCVPLKKAVDMVLNGEIKDAKTQCAVLKVNELIRRGRF